MHTVEQWQTIATEQNGSRKCHQAVLMALNKWLLIDMLWQQRRPVTMSSTDFKSCYDWVAHNMTYLAAVWQGAAPKAVTSMLTTLQQAHHWVRTAFGVSCQGYGPTQPPLQGLGQGNGFAPSGWAALSLPIIKALKSTNFGIEITSPLTGNTIRITCFVFVGDDTGLINACHLNTSTQNLIDQLQQGVDIVWEGCCLATGWQGHVTG